MGTYGYYSDEPRERWMALHILDAPALSPPINSNTPTRETHIYIGRHIDRETQRKTDRDRQIQIDGEIETADKERHRQRQIEI